MQSIDDRIFVATTTAALVLWMTVNAVWQLGYLSLITPVMGLDFPSPELIVGLMLLLVHLAGLISACRSSWPAVLLGTLTPLLANAALHAIVHTFRPQGLIVW